MLKVELATVDMFDSIYNELLVLFGEHQTRDVWKFIFEYHWQVEEEQRGYVLLDDDDIVGFLGTIFAERIIDNQKIKTCNLAAWLVKEEFRSNSIMLLFPILNKKDYVFLNLTAKDTVVDIFIKLGFEILDEYEYIIFPLKSILLFKKNLNLISTRKIQDVESNLSENDKKIYYDHNFKQYKHLFIFKKNNLHEYCYIVYHISRFRKLKMTAIDYISNTSFFAEESIFIFNRMLKESIIPLISIDSRMLPQFNTAIKVTHKLRSPRLYKAVGDPPVIRDNLYTEMGMLQL